MAALKEILADETTAKELFAQETVEAALAFLQGKGVEISPEMGTELKEVFAVAKKVQAGELSEDDLENVAGGRGYVFENLLGLPTKKGTPPRAALNLN